MLTISGLSGLLVRHEQRLAGDYLDIKSFRKAPWLDHVGDVVGLARPPALDQPIDQSRLDKGQSAVIRTTAPASVSSIAPAKRASTSSRGRDTAAVRGVRQAWRPGRRFVRPRSRARFRRGSGSVRVGRAPLPGRDAPRSPIGPCRGGAARMSGPARPPARSPRDGRSSRCLLVARRSPAETLTLEDQDLETVLIVSTPLEADGGEGGLRYRIPWSNRGGYRLNSVPQERECRRRGDGIASNAAPAGLGERLIPTSTPLPAAVDG